MTVPAQKIPDAAEDADMRGLLLILWRRRVLITGVFLFGL